MSENTENIILTVTLNPSIDKAYYMDTNPIVGSVNRAKKIINTAGGKGLNVARVVNTCGEMQEVFGCKISSVATGFVGGYNGQYLLSMLSADGVDHDFVQINGETRSSINVLNGPSSTEFLEPGPLISAEDTEKFISKFKNILNSGKICAVIISGSLPQGVTKDIYSKIISITKQYGANPYLDTSGDALNHAIFCTDSSSKPCFVKPNKDEAQDLLCISINSIKDAEDAAVQISQQGIDIVAITLGAEGAVIANEGKTYYDKIDAHNLGVVNTVGCGDTFVGAFASARCCGNDMQKCLKLALVASKCNAASKLTGNVDKDLFLSLI